MTFLSGAAIGIIITVTAQYMQRSLKNWRAAARRWDREARYYGH